MITVGLDIGTTSVKAVAVDDDGQVVARSRVPHELRVGAGDLFEHDAAAAWVDGVRAAYSQLGDVGSAGVGVSAMVPALAAVDDTGRPISAGLLYGDGRGTTDEAQLGPMGSGEVEAFLRWLQARYPDAHGYWPPPAVAAAALGFDPVVDLGIAASFYPIFDGTGWDAKRLAELGVREDQLPLTLLPQGACAGRRGDVALVAGGIDGMAEQIPSGITVPGEVLVMCGTTLISWTAVADYRAVDGLWTIPSQGGGLFLIGGPSNAGGLFLNWVRRVLTGTDGQPAAEAVADVGGGLDPEHVPVWLPYIRGERTPLHDPGRRAVLIGLGLVHDAAALRRAAYEAAGFVVRHHVDLVGEPVRRIRAVGGGVLDPAWMQALADCTGRPVECAAEPEGAARGMAWLARMAAGAETSLTDATRWARVGRIVEPDPRWVGPCEQRYTTFRQASERPDLFR
jgi:xylulokinase